MELLLATKNIHKIREIRSLLKTLNHLDLYSLNDFPAYIPPPENGKSFEENAILKAVHAAKTLGKWTIADDSGLIVPALNGAPGILSARYAGKNASDLDNRNKLLKEMQNLSGISRSACFECAIALASPEGLKKCFHGLCEGTIITEERGRNGFGYDSLFIKHDYQKTFGELEESVKNQVSHRAKAVEKLKLFLETLLH